MKIKIIKLSPWIDPGLRGFDPWKHKKEIELDCNGIGIDIDPILIDNKCPIPRGVSFKNHKYHFFVKNIKLRKLEVEHCENLIFENCTLGLVRFYSCKHINFKNTIINRELFLGDCNNLTLENCFIKKIILDQSNNNFLKESYFVKIKDWESKNNIYEKNKIKKFETNVNEMTFNQRNTFKDNKVKKIRYRLRKLSNASSLSQEPWFFVFITIFIFFLCFILFLPFINPRLFLNMSIDSSFKIVEIMARLYGLGIIFILILCMYIPTIYYNIKLKILKILSKN